MESDDPQVAADAGLALLEVRDRGLKPFAHSYWRAAFRCFGSGWKPRAVS
jgi:hypothetical protein